MNLNVIKWPKASKMPIPIRKNDFEQRIEAKLRPKITEEIKDKTEVEAVFFLGEWMADIHKAATKTKNEKKKEQLEFEYDYVMMIYDQLLERLL